MKLLAVLIPALLDAQCVQCFRNAAAQHAERAKLMNVAILLMFIPVLILMGFFVWIAYKRRN